MRSLPCVAALQLIQGNLSSSVLSLGVRGTLPASHFFRAWCSRAFQGPSAMLVLSESAWFPWGWSEQ